MTRGTLGFRIGCAVLASAGLVGCAQSGNKAQTSQSQQSSSSANGSTSQQPVSVVTAAADVAGAAAGAVTGAVNGAVNGAVAGANGGTVSRHHAPRIKRNGRGGYDASELQQDALRRAHAAADRYGTIDRTRPPPSTQPSGR